MSENDVNGLKVDLAVLKTKQDTCSENLQKLEDKVDKMQTKLVAVVSGVAALTAGGGAVVGNFLQGLF